MEGRGPNQIAKQLKNCQAQISKDEKRISELKRLFMKIYEDNAGGRREQSIHIEYNCVGFIPINGLTEKQTA